MKHIFRLPVLAGAIVMAAVMASLTPTTSSRIHAQAVVYYYNPYGQGPYGGYGYASSVPNRTRFPSHGDMFGNRAYQYSAYGNITPGYGNRVDYGIGPPVRAYGGSGNYRPGPVYVPFGYRDY